MASRARLDALLLAGFSAFLFFYGLSYFGLIGADEPRYAQVAREMLERRDWVTPTLGLQPWLEKPPFYYWQAIVAYKIFGVSDWAARLPSAIDATALLLAVYIFLRRFFRGVELDGALIVASCAGVIGYARAASTDMPLAAPFGIAMLGWWAWRQSSQRIYLAAFFSFLALATLAKGPVAPFLAALIIVLYALISREFSFALRTLWLPGVLLYCVIALPWYIAVQIRNPIFFREFIVQQNLGRFSQNLYHHIQPFWYYVPVLLLALAPWTVLAVAAFVGGVRRWRLNRRGDQSIPGSEAVAEIDFCRFSACWLVIPVAFFSISQSKLPGYILPALPAGGLLLAIYMRGKLRDESARPSKPLVVAHGALTSILIVLSLLISYLVSQHHLPRGKPLFVAIAVALILWLSMILTLTHKNGFAMLRFVTLIPVILGVGALLKLGSVAIDETFSARPLAREITRIDFNQLPLAVYHVHRELEYGLTFYRNQLTFNYDWGRVPEQEHLLVAPEGSQIEVAKLVAGRRVSFLGHYAPQHVDYYWISAAGSFTH